ncbi:MAG: hypothetical protein ACYCZX_16385 [Rhodospirillaceae bacterium]
MAAVALAWAGPAAAYTPKWLACTGDVTITPNGTSAQPSKEAAEDVYVYDDDAKTLFKYSPTRKSLAYVGANRYTDGEIAWTGSSSGIDSSSWEGRLDRKTLGLSLSYKTAAETRTWAEQCKPTTPREESQL